MTKRCFFYIKCVLFVLVLSISGEISAQEKRDSVRIYFHQGKVNIDHCCPLKIWTILKSLTIKIKLVH